jgi:hypothetical protein
MKRNTRKRNNAANSVILIKIENVCSLIAICYVDRYRMDYATQEYPNTIKYEVHTSIIESSEIKWMRIENIYSAMVLA